MPGIQPWTARTATPVFRSHRASDHGKLPKPPILRRVIGLSPLRFAPRSCERPAKRYHEAISLAHVGQTTEGREGLFVDTPQTGLSVFFGRQRNGRCDFARMGYVHDYCQEDIH